MTDGYTGALRRILDQPDEQPDESARTIAASEARFREVFDSAPLGMVISHLDGPITQSNSALTEILHYLPAELAGRRFRELVHPDDAAILSAAYQELLKGKPSRFRTQVKLRNADGEATWVSLAVSVLRDADGTPTHDITMVEDYTEVHLLEQNLRHQTLHDVRTGLPNQEYFWIHLGSVLERARRSSAEVTLCKIDLDGFAVINDGHGHDAGNTVLRTVAARLQALVVGQRAMVARFGADEFAILIEDCATTPEPAALAVTITDKLAEPIHLSGQGAGYRLAVTAGIGIARRPARGLTATELVRTADATLHRAKRTGRGQWGLDDPAADAAEQARYTLASEMPLAWENGLVTLCYQPLIRLDPAAPDVGQVTAVQAVLHWEHPHQGGLAPEDCAALAEQTGLIRTIGPWMLRTACDQLRRWRDQLGAAAPPVRVDLTTHLAQDPDLMAVLRAALNTARLTPKDLQIGMPVEPVVADRGDACENLRTLADAGIWTVLTRYGQAVGNLATLENQPVNAVDISDPLVRMTQQPGSMVREALATLVPLIRRTGTAVVAAGIDSPEQADWWRSIGADSARGTALAPPTTGQDIPARLVAP
ncbi:MAG: putative bifunctional diguanylate cyclase/phosphodiesterase [Pseudonocardiales bacterium]